MNCRKINVSSESWGLDFFLNAVSGMSSLKLHRHLTQLHSEGLLFCVLLRVTRFVSTFLVRIVVVIVAS